MLMKKFLLTTFMAVTTIVAMAQTKSYTDNLVVTIDGESSDPQETTIVVEQNTCYTDNLVVTIDSDSSDPQETTIAVKQSTNGTYTLSLNNFVLGGMIQVGNIVVDNITATETNGVKNFTVNRNINITAGEGEGDWFGPLLGEVPVNLTGKMDAANLYCSIDITMEGLGVINVVFGDENLNSGNNSANYTYTLSLNNFVLGGMIQVGNIVVDNITATETNGVKNFTVNRNINITAGEGEGDWFGPLLGEVPVNLTGKMDAANLYCSIDITMEGLGVINVVFGDEDSATSIENIAVANGTKRIFDITGREVKEITAPGIYIVNGKKIFVK